MGTDFHEWSSTSFFQIRPSVSLVLRQRAPRHTNRILLPRALVSWNFRTGSIFIGMFPSPDEHSPPRKSVLQFTNQKCDEKTNRHHPATYLYTELLLFECGVHPQTP